MKNNLLITGGAGFIGVNAAEYFARSGWRVTVLDNLSRRGTEANLAWLQKAAKVEFVKCDIRDAAAVNAVVAAVRPSDLLHLAGQVAVTTSVTDPRHDFETNALGTFNVLEAVRRETPETIVVYSSTNKVYGKLDSHPVVEKDGRYVYRDHPQGADENCQLDFHSPYGCSKGAADQYVLDYARIYGLRATSFRQSCIYGQRQFGVEDQGWVAWFTIAATLGWPITIFGDGKQVRDVLHVDDLLEAYAAAFRQPEKVSGASFNIGGGPDKTLSLLELVAALSAELGRQIRPAFQDWRPGDQKVFVCDISKVDRVLGWKPRIGVAGGVRRLIEWVRENRQVLEDQHRLA
jgi:CDP-paratose 2-epimerase